jgi:hypothetical protein
MPKYAPRQARASYTWHLRAPFNLEFNADQWWKNEKGAAVDSVSALYELARRHPSIGAIRLKYKGSIWHGQELRPPLHGEALKEMNSAAYGDLGDGPTPIHCLCLIGLKCWAQLDWRDQEYWEMSAGKLKGVDCRHGLEQCLSLTDQAVSKLIHARIRNLNPPKGSMAYYVEGGRGNNPKEVRPANPELHRQVHEKLAHDLRRSPIPEAEIEREIAQLAIDAHREGSFIFAIAPNITHDRAVELLTKAYQNDRDTFGSDEQRSRWADWLSAIEEYEDDERSRGVAKAAVFTRYCRMFDGMDFATTLPPATAKISRGH